jgi:hypothetical protein
MPSPSEIARDKQPYVPELNGSHEHEHEMGRGRAVAAYPHTQLRD